VAKYHRAFHTTAPGSASRWSSVRRTAGRSCRSGATAARVFAVCSVTASDAGMDEVLWMMNTAKLTAVAA
jgi:hypothetical protein